TAPTPPPAQPTPDSQANVVRLLEWCWNQRDAAKYCEVLTSDFKFNFAPLDTAATRFGGVWFRADELESANRLFVTGNGTEPPATSITMSLDPSLTTQNVVRPGVGISRHYFKIVSALPLHVLTVH